MRLVTASSVLLISIESSPQKVGQVQPREMFLSSYTENTAPIHLLSLNFSGLQHHDRNAARGHLLIIQILGMSFCNELPQAIIFIPLSIVRVNGNPLPIDPNHSMRFF